MSSKRKPYARDKKQRIYNVINCALEIIENHSYDSLSMNLIHRLTKIPIGTLYKDFPDGKEDILLEIFKSYRDELDERYDKFDDDTLRKFIYHSLDTGRKRRKLLIALQIETLRNPESFLIKARKYVSDIDFSFFKKAVEYIAGRSLPMPLVYEMLAVWKAIIRQHIIYRNLYGSDEKFYEMILKILRGLSN
jgi:AcrR family transcriptional regulator